MFSIPQMVLVTLWFTFYNLLTSGTGLGLAAGGVVLNGLVVGAIMGDISTGFYLGGTYELMNIGLNPLGGSTVPNYNMGVVVGVAFGAVAGVETGMAVGIVVATLASTLDVLAKMVGSFFLHKAQDAVGKKNIKGAMNWIRLGFWPRILLDATIPLIILFAFGAPLVEAINSVIPAWLLSGFKTARQYAAGHRFCHPAAFHEHQGQLPVRHHRLCPVRLPRHRRTGRSPCGCGAGHDRIPEQRPHCRSPEYGRCW